MWEIWIHNTRSGAPELPLAAAAGPVSAASSPAASGSWTRRLGSIGFGTHSIRLRNAGLPKTLIREIARGNKYTLAQRWGTHCAYAGVIQGRRFNEAGSLLTLRHKELRAALLGWRLIHGVNEYDPSAGVLTVTSRSHAGVIRAILNTATKGGQTGWELPIDLPSDGAGSFNATWRHEDGFTTEQLLTQVEKDGAETDLAPYITSAGYLRYQARVASTIVDGAPFLLAARAPGSIVVDLDTDEDYAAQMTGVLGFGNGTGQDRLARYAPTTGGGVRDLPVKDVKVDFPDIYDATRLQSALNSDFAIRNFPTEQWSFGLFIGSTGPAIAAPGRVLDMHIHGSDFITDGSHPQRVIALAGDMTHMMKPEVQNYA